MIYGKFALVVAFGLLLANKSCKHASQHSGVLSSKASLISKNDPGIYFLDERELQKNPRQLGKATIYKVECGGEDRFIQSDAASLLKHCKVLASRSLLEFVSYEAHPSLTSGTDVVTPEHSQFIHFLLSSFRTYQNRSTPLTLDLEAFGEMDFGTREAVYSERFQRWLPRVEQWLRPERPDHSESFFWGKATNFNVNAGWNTLELKPDQVADSDRIGLKIAGQCSVGVSSIRGLVNSEWQAFLADGFQIDSNGNLSAALFKSEIPVAVSAIKIVLKSEQASLCTFSLHHGQITQDELEPVTERSLAEQFQEAAELFSRPSQRLHHLMWHAVRNSWLRPGTTDQDRNMLARSIQGQDWRPVRPVVYTNGVVDPAMTESRYPGAGEDFFHMHRKMIELASGAFGKGQFPKVETIQDLYAQRDRLIAAGIAQKVPVTSVQQFRSRQGMIAQQEERLQQLLNSGATLGQLGSHLEWTLHNSLHDAFSRPAQEILTSAAVNPWSMGARFFDPQFIWNSRQYSHLGDPYASASNPVFWLIHSYVDHWVDRWVGTQSQYDEIADKCEGRPRCYQWLQNSESPVPWDGPGHSQHGEGGDQQLRVSSLPDALSRELMNRSTFTTIE